MRSVGSVNVAKAIKAAVMVLCLSVMFALARMPVSEQSGDKPTVKQEDTGEEASFVFIKIKPTLHRKSRVPPKLPSYLPGIHRGSDLYAILGSANSKGYGILLAWDPDCQGQNVCLYGSTEGSISRIKLDRGPGVPVKLRQGIQGRFIDTECFAYCNESFVTWREAGFYYAIGVKAGRKDDLLRAANSAIAAGR